MPGGMQAGSGPHNPALLAGLMMGDRSAVTMSQYSIGIPPCSIAIHGQSAPY